MKNKFNIMLKLSFCNYVHFAVKFLFTEWYGRLLFWYLHLNWY